MYTNIRVRAHQNRSGFRLTQSSDCWGKCCVSPYWLPIAMGEMVTPKMMQAFLLAFFEIFSFLRARQRSINGNADYCGTGNFYPRLSGECKGDDMDNICDEN